MQLISSLFESFPNGALQFCVLDFYFESPERKRGCRDLSVSALRRSEGAQNRLEQQTDAASRTLETPFLEEYGLFLLISAFVIKTCGFCISRRLVRQVEQQPAGGGPLDTPWKKRLFVLRCTETPTKSIREVARCDNAT